MSTATATATATLTNTSQSYGSVAKTFHWLTALLILTSIPLGMIANALPFETSAQLAFKGQLFSLHKTLGLLAFFVALGRILWAAVQPKPALLHPERKLESWLAETVHWLLYTSLVIVPLSGWLHHAATTGFAPIWWPFGQSLPFVPKDEALAGFFAAWHWTFTKVLGFAVLLHIAGALKHHVIDRDETLARMLPGRPVAAGAPATGHSRAPFWTAAAIWAVAVIGGSALGLSKETAGAGALPELQAQPSGWTVDEGTLAISVVQMGSAVEGSFASWQAAINFSEDVAEPVKGDVSVDIAIPSLTLGSITGEALKAEFFDAETHPTANFTADILQPEGAEDGAYVAQGLLTLKGVEAPLSLPFTLVLDGDQATMSGETVIDRRSFEIGTASYNDEATVRFEVTVRVDLVATRGGAEEDGGAS